MTDIEASESSGMDASVSDDKRCLFLDLLPAEMRNNIYEYALSDDSGTVTFVPDQSHDPQNTKAARRYSATNNAFALLYTCKQIRDEVGDKWIYELNTVNFDVSDDWKAVRFIAARQKRTNHLKKLNFHTAWIGSSNDIRTFLESNNEPLRYFRRACESLSISFSFKGRGSCAEWNVTLNDLVKAAEQMEEEILPQMRDLVTRPGTPLGGVNSYLVIKSRILRNFWPLWAVRNGYDK